MFEIAQEKYSNALIALGVVVCIVILYKVLPSSDKIDNVEGFKGASLDQLPITTKSNNSNVESSLLLQNHKSEYEDTIINLEESIHLQILKALKSGGSSISKDASSKESYNHIRKINELRKLKKALNETMTYLDQR